MALIKLCTVVAALRVLPNRSQFFQYDSVSLSCGQQGNSAKWTIQRNTSLHINQECFTSWNRTIEPHCVFDDLYPSDTGVYWCESAAGECSEAASITVTAGSVILESPALPVMEGDEVTLRCTTRRASSSSLTADFYKDGLLIRSSSAGNLTIRSVSKADEGLYKCNVPAGQSPDSWLTVRADQTEVLETRPTCRPEPPHSLAAILLPVVAKCFLLASVMLLCLWRGRKGRIEPSVVLYSDVTCTQMCNRKGEPQLRHSFLLASVAVYQPNAARWIDTPEAPLQLSRKTD